MVFPSGQTSTEVMRPREPKPEGQEDPPLSMGAPLPSEQLDRACPPAVAHVLTTPPTVIGGTHFWVVCPARESPGPHTGQESTQRWLSLAYKSHIWGPHLQVSQSPWSPGPETSESSVHPAWFAAKRHIQAERTSRWQLITAIASAAAPFGCLKAL